MTFFGWGKKHLEWSMIIDEKEIMVCCVYSYFSINFIPIVTGAVWYEEDLEDGQLKEVKYIDLKHKYGIQTPKLAWYRRFGLLVIPLIVGLIFAILYSLITIVFPPINLN